MPEGHLPASARPLALALIGQAEGLGQAMRAGSPTALPQAHALAGQARAVLESVVWAPGEEWPACQVEGLRSLSSGEDFGLVLRGSGDLALVWGDSCLNLEFRAAGDCLAGYDGEGFVLTATGCLDEDSFEERARSQDTRLDETLERPIPNGQVTPGAGWEGAAEDSLGGDWLRWLGTATSAVRQVAARRGKKAPAGRAETPTSVEKESVSAADPVRKGASSENEGTCRHCRADLVPGARFCSTCGKSTAPVCPACGVAVPAHAAFCHECGQAVRP